MSQDKATLLIVDDAPENIEVLGSLLSRDYDVKVAIDGAGALRLAFAEPPDLILLDVMMPHMDGYEVCRYLKANPVTRRIPVIFVTALDQQENEALGFAVGGADYITKPIQPVIVEARVRTHLALYDQRRDLETQVRIRTEELETTRLEIINCLGLAAEFKDNDTGMHVQRVAGTSHLLALKLGWNNEAADQLRHAATMHDIGKIGIPDRVLLKPGKLDAEEWAIMQRHCEIGARILGSHTAPLMAVARTVALSHHERWDGAGYPAGLRGDHIPLAGRIVAVADAFDALCSVRPYKRPWPLQDTLAHMRAQAGLQFDPQVMVVFDVILPEVLAVQSRCPDDVALPAPATVMLSN
ncbi:MAG: response regulator [Methylococcaceae bacterium]|nr:MAG: response regulator [Methylococcaceae bacterium]